MSKPFSNRNNSHFSSDKRNFVSRLLFSGKEFHLHFDRKTTSSGSRPTIRLVRRDKPVYREPGVLHRLRDFGRRFENFPIPSIEKQLNNIQPKTKKQAVILKTGQLSYKAFKQPLKLAWKSALLADTIVHSGASIAFHRLSGAIQNQAAQLDTGKAAVKVLSFGAGVLKARKAIIRQGLKKRSYSQKKAAYLSFRKNAQKAKTEFKAQKKHYKITKKRTKHNAKKGRPLLYKALERRRKTEKKLKNVAKKEYKLQKSRKRHALGERFLDVPVPIIIIAPAHLSKIGVSKLWSGIKSAGADNDALKAVSSSAKVANTMRKGASRGIRKVRHYKSRNYSKHYNKKANRLQKRKRKIKNKNAAKAKKRAKKAQRSSAKAVKAVANTIKATAKVIINGIKETAEKFV